MNAQLLVEALTNQELENVMIQRHSTVEMIALLMDQPTLTLKGATKIYVQVALYLVMVIDIYYFHD